MLVLMRVWLALSCAMSLHASQAFLLSSPVSSLRPSRTAIGAGVKETGLQSPGGQMKSRRAWSDFINHTEESLLGRRRERRAALVGWNLDSQACLGLYMPAATSTLPPTCLIHFIGDFFASGNPVGCYKELLENVAEATGAAVIATAWNCGAGSQLQEAVSCGNEFVRGKGLLSRMWSGERADDPDALEETEDDRDSILRDKQKVLNLPVVGMTHGMGGELLGLLSSLPPAKREAMGLSKQNNANLFLAPCIPDPRDVNLPPVRSGDGGGSEEMRADFLRLCEFFRVIDARREEQPSLFLPLNALDLDVEFARAEEEKARAEGKKGYIEESEKWNVDSGMCAGPSSSSLCAEIENELEEERKRWKKEIDAVEVARREFLLRTLALVSRLPGPSAETSGAFASQASRLMRILLRYAKQFLSTLQTYADTKGDEEGATLAQQRAGALAGVMKDLVPRIEKAQGLWVRMEALVRARLALSHFRGVLPQPAPPATVLGDFVRSEAAELEAELWQLLRSPAEAHVPSFLQSLGGKVPDSEALSLGGKRMGEAAAKKALTISLLTTEFGSGWGEELGGAITESLAKGWGDKDELAVKERMRKSADSTVLLSLLSCAQTLLRATEDGGAVERLRPKLPDQTVEETFPVFSPQIFFSGLGGDSSSSIPPKFNPPRPVVEQALTASYRCPRTAVLTPSGEQSAEMKRYYAEFADLLRQASKEGGVVSEDELPGSHFSVGSVFFRNFMRHVDGVRRREQSAASGSKSRTALERLGIDPSQLGMGGEEDREEVLWEFLNPKDGGSTALLGRGAGLGSNPCVSSLLGVPSPDGSAVSVLHSEKKLLPRLVDRVAAEVCSAVGTSRNKWEVGTPRRMQSAPVGAN
uniref:Uncharacterized protein n=1 Tax=Chromera velia CCMP2878 TaxID=1169474 RepID=A0A0G4FUR9_9ALVE|mmetsp:Transcript_8491/g.16563  ORF Transcript_8491/g.16563 Transcript_8491/m.16563 type:complete len:872 (+) Transcript_8491:56-2671(+)|eukprot:Cvel_3777.t1-p1 / transcript=Cvel_3777.t1 / gene=Cvel_3777 / organism=Chromera_velia_CCMP2878 / gene_product=hypothetical protein / transcript_product=hypothetical protein / location=Cvel_scaffold158:70419-73664(+) / protein_length=871 / sequence_SO=supercontig / SO=protein_coding / is_pseudo=false